MAQYDYNSTTGFPRAGAAVNVDQGLRSHMLGVYNYMAAGVALTGAVAYGINQLAVQNGALTSFGQAIYGSPLRWVIMFAPLAIVIFMSVRSHRMSVGAAQATFWIYAAAVGASVSYILLKYTGMSIARTFFITSAAFAGLSIFGYTTKRNLSGWGSFLVMGLIGVIIASIVQIFLQSPALQFALSVLGLLIFAGFTAYDTQQIKDDYFAYGGAGGDTLAKSAIFGALSLYQDFVGIFLNLLQFTGDRE